MIARETGLLIVDEAWVREVLMILVLLQRLRPRLIGLGTCLVTLLPCGEGVMVEGVLMEVVMMFPDKVEVLRVFSRACVFLCKFCRGTSAWGLTWSTTWSCWLGTDTP